MRDYANIFEVVRAQDLSALKQAVLEVPKVMAEVNEDGVPAIHIAAATGDLEMMEYIIEYSIVNPCILDKQGNTILHYAVRSGDLELVKYLVERVGMYIEQANLLGITAFDVAEGLREKYADAKELADITAICDYFKQCLGASMDELYHNPIRRGMHPDPSIVRVGEDYYMVNSSFVLFPSIPVSHSKDLLHWEVIGHAITNPEWARLKDLEGGRGYWAPDISYNEGKFYITATYRMNDGGEKLRYQMVTSSEKPEGPYCEPVFLDEDGIDPSIFTDVDGRRYMLLNRGARIFEISKDGREIIAQPQLLWYGYHKKATEGPHLLHKDGYYYLFMAEGGTGKGHRISVARSKTLMGPYESCPYNPILRQWDEERQMQCCGHGKPVQTPDGDWYIVYLCSRYGTAGYGILGRETAMDPLTWTADGWPIVNMLKGPSDLQRKPKVRKEIAEDADKKLHDLDAQKTAKDACDEKVYAGGVQNDEGTRASVWNQWSTVRGASAESYEMKQTESGWQVVIHGNGLDLNTLDYGTILLQPQQDFSFEMESRIVVEETTSSDWDAGLTCYYDENSYLKLALADRQGTMGVLVAEYVGEGYVTEKFIELETTDLKAEQAAQGVGAKMSMEFRIVTEDLKRSCFYRAAGNWTLATVLENTSYLSSEGLRKGKRFTGAMAGIYVHGNLTAAFEDYQVKC